uniref:FAD/NAD(P)-binding domain-containing protein n=1 Tax=Ditylenchus dipsaci TaxID=166011 RepID=A0A915DWP2_9BILA
MLPDDQWIDVCALDDLTPNTGAGALVAVKRLQSSVQANVMSRGIIGDLQATGRCLEDKDQKLAVYPSKIVDGRVWVNAVPQKTYITNTGVSQDKLKLVLIGNGLAGMRCLEDLLDMAPDRYEVTVIGEEPWEALIGDENGHVKQIRLKDGTVLDADLLVFAVGIRPNIALAQSAGLRCNRGVLVNDTMQTFDPSIYAVGQLLTEDYYVVNKFVKAIWVLQISTPTHAFVCHLRWQVTNAALVKTLCQQVMKILTCRHGGFGWFQYRMVPSCAVSADYAG